LAITIVGLGPGPYRALTLEAVEALAAAKDLYLRTRVHPTVDEFPPTLRWTSFDALYERAADFDALYDEIASVLLERGLSTDVVYAVPGHPLLGEASVQRVLARAAEAGVTTRVVGGLSFAEAALSASGSAGVDQVQLVDALDLPPLVPTLPLLVHQVYKPAVASEVKLALLRLYPPEHAVVVVRGASTAAETVDRLPLATLDRAVVFDHLTTLYVPPLPHEHDYGTLPGMAYLVGRLRRECPWDAKQTHQSLKRYMLEEAYEAAEAIAEADYVALADELGDVLLQVVLHAEIADERGDFDLIDVLHGLCAKLVRRHPHVFGSTEVADAAEVERNWEAIKRGERGDEEQTPSLLDGLPRHHPALVTAQELFKRLSKSGLAPSTDDRADRLRAALEAFAAETDAARRERSLGEILFWLSGLARNAGLDAEDALRGTVGRVAARVRDVEARVRAEGRGPKTWGVAEREELWKESGHLP